MSAMPDFKLSDIVDPGMKNSLEQIIKRATAIIQWAKQGLALMEEGQEAESDKRHEAAAFLEDHKRYAGMTPWSAIQYMFKTLHFALTKDQIVKEIVGHGFWPQKEPERKITRGLLEGMVGGCVTAKKNTGDLIERGGRFAPKENIKYFDNQMPQWFADQSKRDGSTQ